MNIPAFDTQKAVKEFKEGGFNDKQAEAVVTTMNDVMSQNFATKADLLTLQSDMKQTIEKVRSDLEKSIEKVRSDLEKSIADKFEALYRHKFEALYRHLWVMGIGIVLANVTLVAAAVALLGHKIG